MDYPGLRGTSYEKDHASDYGQKGWSQREEKLGP